jgi:hypothetical protein
METQMQGDRNIWYLTIGALCGCALLVFATPAMAEQVSREQDIVNLRLGQRIQVDDGSGARMTADGIVRAVQCVARLGTKK